MLVLNLATFHFLLRDTLYCFYKSTATVLHYHIATLLQCYSSQDVFGSQLHSVNGLTDHQGTHHYSRPTESQLFSITAHQNIFMSCNFNGQSHLAAHLARCLRRMACVSHVSMSHDPAEQRGQEKEAQRQKAMDSHWQVSTHSWLLVVLVGKSKLRAWFTRPRVNHNTV